MSWAQLYLAVPGAGQLSPGPGPAHQEVFGWMRFFWEYSGFVSYPPFNIILFASDAADWVAGSLQPSLSTWRSAPESFSGHAYVQTATSWLRGGVASSASFWSAGTPLPLSKVCVVRTINVSGPQPIYGRHFVSGIDESDLEEDTLKLGSLATLQSNCQRLKNPLVSQGITFLPRMATYKGDALVGIDYVLVNQRLTILKRRGRGIRSTVNWNTPGTVPGYP